MTDDTHKAIAHEVAAHAVVLYMKGTAEQPMCGFSSVVVKALRALDAAFHDVNVLDDPALREGIKSFSSWPTLPQLYVGGEFVGGADIVREMAANGELEQLLRDKGALA